MTKPTAETIAHKRTKILAATVATLGVLILLAVATIYGNFSLTSFAKSKNPSYACRSGKCLNVMPSTTPASDPCANTTDSKTRQKCLETQREILIKNQRTATPPGTLKGGKNLQYEQQHIKNVYMLQPSKPYLTPTPTVTPTPQQ